MVEVDTFVVALVILVLILVIAAYRKGKPRASPSIKDALESHPNWGIVLGFGGATTPLKLRTILSVTAGTISFQDHDPLNGKRVYEATYKLTDNTLVITYKFVGESPSDSSPSDSSPSDACGCLVQETITDNGTLPYSLVMKSGPITAYGVVMPKIDS